MAKFVFGVSPPKPKKDIEDSDNPLICLRPFSKKTILTFNCIVGCTKVKSLKIINPNDKPDRVSFLSVPLEDGIDISNYDIDLLPHRTEVLKIRWTPTDVMQKKLLLKYTYGKYNSQIELICTSKVAQGKCSNKTKFSRTDENSHIQFGKRQNKNRVLQPLSNAQCSYELNCENLIERQHFNSTFIADKENQKDINLYKLLQDPLDLGNENISGSCPDKYSSSFETKQLDLALIQAGILKTCINFIFDPLPCSNAVKIEDVSLPNKNDSDSAPEILCQRSLPNKSIQLPRPIFQSYKAVEILDAQRKLSCKLYEKQDVQRVICKVDDLVKQNKIFIKKEILLFKSLGIKKNLLSLIHSYNPAWLRLGLETVYGVIIPMQSSEDTNNLTLFLNQRWLSVWGKDQLMINSKQPSSLEDSYKSSLLASFLKIVYFLDVAKQHNLIEYDPCLFSKTSNIKSSQELLVTFCNQYLHGEGDIIKHLRYSGYVVKVVQTYLDEFNYQVVNVGSDFRCGIRLARIVEQLFGCRLQNQLKVPPNSKAQRLKNIDTVLNTLKSKGLPLDQITSQNIADGHQEATLSLLWSLVLNHVVVYLDQSQDLAQEILQLEYEVKMRGTTVPNRSQVKIDPSCVELSSWPLIEWCQLICCLYNLQVLDLTSHELGHILCCIMHYYHPGLIDLPISSHRLEKGTSKESDIQTEEAFASFQSAISCLGGIPYLLSKYCTSAGLDGRTVILQLSLLCQRLLDIRTITRAVRIIQKRWRMKIQLKQEKQEAALRREARIRYLNAAVKLQRWYRAKRPRLLELRQCRAVEAIQRWFRNILEFRAQRRFYLALKTQAIYIQRRFRWIRLKRKREEASVIIQTWYKGVQLMQGCRKEYLSMRLNALLIQRWYRACVKRDKCRNELALLRKSTIVIQRWYCSCVLTRNCRNQYRKILGSVRRIQMWYRGIRRTRQDRNTFISVKRSASKIQATYRARKQRRFFLRLRLACSLIQLWYRNKLTLRQERTKFLNTKNAVIKIQRRFREYVLTRQCLHDFKMKRDGAIRIQTWWRSKRGRHEFLLKRRSALHIQTFYREYLRRRKKLEKLNLSAVIIQKYVRRLLAERRCLRMKQARAVEIISNHYLCFKARERLKDLKLARQTRAVICIQSVVRRFLAIKAYTKKLNEYKAHALRVESAVVLIQRWLRRTMPLLRSRRLEERSATIIQSFWRGHRVRIHSQTVLRPLNKRTATLTTNVEETVGHKLLLCIATLHSEGNIAMKINAIRSLEKYCRVIPVCCELVVSRGIVSTLYDLIPCLNRSVPHMVLISHFLEVLLCLSQNSASVRGLFEGCEWVPALVSVLSKFCYGSPLLVIKATTILYIILSNGGSRREFVDNPNSEGAVIGAFNYWQRKAKYKGNIVISDEKTTTWTLLNLTRSQPIITLSSVLRDKQALDTFTALFYLKKFLYC